MTDLVTTVLEKTVMKRAPEVQQFVDKIAKNLFGETADRSCISCKDRVAGRESFRDDLSWKEYGISTLCQACQDSVFGA